MFEHCPDHRKTCDFVPFHFKNSEGFSFHKCLTCGIVFETASDIEKNKELSVNAIVDAKER